MASVLVAGTGSLPYLRPPSTSPHWCGTSVGLHAGKLVPLHDMLGHFDPAGSDNLRCSIIELRIPGLILQHHATAGKLRRERAHTFFSQADPTQVNTPVPDTNVRMRQLLSPT